MPTGNPVIRDAAAADVNALVAFEIEIARISFPDQPLDDPAFHAGRIHAAVSDLREGTFVAMGDAFYDILGWVWVSARTNFLTKDRYGFVRSLAVSESKRGSLVANALLDRAVTLALDGGAEEIIGKVHVDNLAMRVVYATAGFAPTHLTMRLSTEQRLDG